MHEHHRPKTGGRNGEEGNQEKVFIARAIQPFRHSAKRAKL